MATIPSSGRSIRTPLALFRPWALRRSALCLATLRRSAMREVPSLRDPWRSPSPRSLRAGPLRPT
eukprot:1114655-Alexandrium_andersonii.AAC.1